MKSNKKYITTIFILIAYIIYQTFMPVNIGKKIIINKSDYDNMKLVYNKYSDQEKVIKDVKSKFLYNADDEKIKEGSLMGAINGFDEPYTAYMSKEEYKNFFDSINGVYTGIGIMVKIDKKSNMLIVDMVFEDSPAIEVGLKKGDKITKIDGQVIEVNESLEDIVTKMKGQENTKVSLTILRGSEYINFDIIRRQTEIPCLFSQQVDDIGYIRLISFDTHSSKSLKKEIENLKSHNMKKLVLDLRGNPGGLLDEVIEISSLFLPKNSLVTYTKDNKNKKTEYKTHKNIEGFKFPIAILVDENSASASELFSGVMQDSKLATIIGCTTFGKGVVQIINPYNDGSAIKITVSEYFTPKGQKINKHGIKPDVDLSKEMREQLVDQKYPEDIVDDICFKKAVEVLNQE